MCKIAWVGGVLVLALIGRADAQLVDVQTEIYLTGRAAGSSEYGPLRSWVPTVAVLQGPELKVDRDEGPEIRRNASRRIGASVQNARPGESTVPLARSVLIESVAKGGAAFRAGLKPGDIVVFYGWWSNDVDDARAFAGRVADTPAGGVLPVVIVRDGVRSMVSLIPDPAGGAGRD
jgi:S1-C subfamily serine protease